MAALKSVETKGTRTIDDLRTALWDAMEGVKSGDISPVNANAISNSAGKILASVRLELDYAKTLGRRPLIPLLGSGENEDAA